MIIGSFTFILHTHLPYVLHHGKWPHGSDWLSEATAECYIPILGMLESMQADGLDPKISMDFSPINLEQLADPDFATVFVEYCHEKIAAAEKDFVLFSKDGAKEYMRLAEYWREFYSQTKNIFIEQYQGNIVTGFRKLSDDRVLDAMTCGATHGYFPLLLRDDNIRGQINCAIETHEHHFGKRPRGIWLPECGYRPGYKWSPTVGPESYRLSSEERAGVEELVAEAGLEYFVVDGALTKGGTVQGAIDPKRSLTDIYWVGEPGPAHRVPGSENIFGSFHSNDVSTRNPEPGTRNPVAIFSRDAESASRVWDAEKGYPGAGSYLDFHKKHGNSGLRYWKITSLKTDMADKLPYVPSDTEKKLNTQADDFVSLVQTELEEFAKTHSYPGIIASPFDTELFGHWWFEGPRFLGKVMRRISAWKKIGLTDCAESLDNYSEHRATISLPEGSWGFEGQHWVWTNDAVAWMWDTIYPLEDRFLKAIHAYKPTPNEEGGVFPSSMDETLRSIFDQAARELLLLEASDWPFVISTQGAIDYSKMRFAEHAELLTRLLDIAEHYDATKGLSSTDFDFLQGAIGKDRVFPKIDLGWWEKR
jgi:1,4-alpha-glucan branching enzyme